MSEHPDSRRIELVYPRGQRLIVNLESRHQSTEEPPAAGVGGVNIGAGAEPVIQDIVANLDNPTNNGDVVNEPAPENDVSSEATAANSGESGDGDDNDVIAEADEFRPDFEEIHLYDPEDEARADVPPGDGEEDGAEARPGPSSAAEGRPPQLLLAPGPHNPGQRIGARVRARLDDWRLACAPECGRVCAKRRKN